MYRLPRFSTMKFKTLYKAFLLLAVLSDFIDYLITQMGFQRFAPLFEANPYIRLLMRWFNPFLASTIVFAFTLALILGAYMLSRSYLREEPYSGHLKDVWNYLTKSGTVKGRDLFIFASIALYIIFIHMHLTGFISWLRLFMM
jgi:MFS family permease